MAPRSRNVGARLMGFLFRGGGRASGDAARETRGFHGNTLDFAERGEGGGVNIPSRQAHLAAVRKEYMEEVGKMEKIFNSNGLLERDRGYLPPSQREIHDLRRLFLEALAKGEVSNLKEFRQYLAEWLSEGHQNPAMAEHAETAANNLWGAFLQKEKLQLDQIAKNIKVIREGGSPGD